MVTATSFGGRITDHSTDPTHMNARLWDFDVDGTTLKANPFCAIGLLDIQGKRS
jgi:hypothetical protein